MSAHLVRSLLQRPILFNRALVDILDGSIYAALFLGQAIYWSERCDENGWFYKKAEEWEEETALSSKKQAGARAILRAKGYLSEKQDGGTDRKLFYSVNLIKLAADLQAAATSKSLKRSLPTCLNGALEVPKTAASIDAETTTETTTETNGQRRPVHEAGFEQFWAAYPRKVAKRGALKAWVAAAKSRRLPYLENVLAAVQRQGLKLGWFDGSCPADKVPHAATWLNQDRWNDELEIRPLPVIKPAPSLADLAARNLSRAIEDARKEIPKLAPAEDGWTSKSRTVFFEDLDACKTEAEVEAHLVACRALCDRLRAMGAFPLRKPTQPGEILPAGTGRPLAVDLRGAFICDSTCPACGEDQAAGPCSCGDQDDPTVGGPAPVFFPRPICGCGTEMVEFDDGHACPVCERDFLADKEFEGRPALAPSGGDWWCCRADHPDHEPSCPNSNESAARRMEYDGLTGGHAPGITPACPDGGRHEWEPSGKCGRCGENVGGKPFQPRQLYPGHPDWDAYQAEVQKRAEPMLDAAINQLKAKPSAVDSLVINKTVRVREGRIADSQHAFALNALSGKCVWCDQPQDHIRHYLPQELPFWDQSDGTGLDFDEEKRRLDELTAKEPPEFWGEKLFRDEEES